MRIVLLVVALIVLVSVFVGCASTKYLRTMEVTDTITAVGRNSYGHNAIWLQDTKLWGDRTTGSVEISKTDIPFVVGHKYKLVIKVRSGALYGEFYELVSAEEIK